MRKNTLPAAAGGCYGFLAGVNPLAGFDSLRANADNRNLSVMRSFCVRTQPSCARITVGRDGGAFVLAGFISAGLSTLLRLTTPFDSGLVRLINLANEATAMVATPTCLHPEFTFHFLAVRRADLRDTPHRESVTAPDELTARRLLARDFVLLFAGRVPSQGVRHV
ncbi:MULTISPECIES: host cell division inhibitor Icd-like protein [unclassified Serratia (in: enterobacteria)]|uniref:host cell division inhibitor Icd-like protein n=1 Tax=unclassified Serratia (in: enterobacteria) TaxID=2647522 RepID=UPI00307631DB